MAGRYVGCTSSLQIVAVQSLELSSLPSSVVRSTTQKIAHTLSVAIGVQPHSSSSQPICFVFLITSTGRARFANYARASSRMADQITNRAADCPPPTAAPAVAGRARFWGLFRTQQRQRRADIDRHGFLPSAATRPPQNRARGGKSEGEAETQGGSSGEEGELKREKRRASGTADSPQRANTTTTPLAAGSAESFGTVVGRAAAGSPRAPAGGAAPPPPAAATDEREDARAAGGARGVSTLAGEPERREGVAEAARPDEECSPAGSTHEVQEARNSPFCPSQETFHTAVGLKGVRNISDCL